MLVRMREIGEIHVFEDRAFLRWVSRASVVVLLLGFVIAGAWCALVEAVGDAVGRELAAFEIGWDTLFSRPGWWVSLAVALVLSLVAHELVHGFFFRQFAPAGTRVTYGADWRRGMFYACAEGVVFTRRQYEASLIAPTIIVTCGLVVIGIGLKWPLWTIIEATLHLSGCTGDWGYLARMRRDPAITHCEDTSFGVRFLSGLPEGADGFGSDGRYDLEGEPAPGHSVAPIEVDFGGADARATMDGHGGDGPDAASVPSAAGEGRGVAGPDAGAGPVAVEGEAPAVPPVEAPVPGTQAAPVFAVSEPAASSDDRSREGASRPRLVVLDGGNAGCDGAGSQPGPDDVPGLAAAEPMSDSSPAGSRPEGSDASDGKDVRP